MIYIWVGRGVALSLSTAGHNLTDYIMNPTLSTQNTHTHINYVDTRENERLFERHK